MTRSNSTAVYITAASVLNAAGTECAPRDSQPQAAQPLDFDPARLAHCVAAPALPAGVYDRRLSRSLEPQGARLLYCAGRLAETLRGLELPDERIALTAAFASIVPQPAVQEGEQPGVGLCQAKSPGRLRAENGTGRHGRSGAAERIQRAFSRCSNWHCI